MKHALRIGLLAVALALTAGCRQDMHDAPRYEPLERGPFFDDLRAARPLVPGTVSRSALSPDSPLLAVKNGNDFVTTFPFRVDAAVLARGRERYDIYCSPCHARTGLGNGMVVQRGYPQPPSFHEQRLREAAPGYFVNVMTHGFGLMPPYAPQVPPADRWAIAAYIRALQLSRNTALSDLSAEEKKKLLEGSDG